MQRQLYEHFNLPGHSGFLNDVSVTLIAKTNPKDPTKREDYSIHTLKNKSLLGLNLMLQMVIRRNSLYFASLIMFMDGLYLNNDFRTRLLSFIISIAIVVVCWCFWFCYFVCFYYYYYYYYIFIKFFLFFVAMLCIILSYSTVLLFMFMTYVTILCCF